MGGEHPDPVAERGVLAVRPACGRPHEPPHRVAERPIGRGAGVGLAADGDDRRRDARRRLVDQSRLARPHLTHQLDDAADPIRLEPGQRGLQDGELGVAADEGELVGRPGIAVTALRADPVGVDLGALPLDGERLELDGLEHGRRPVEHGRGGVDGTGRGGGHQAGREVHRVTHDGVGRAEARPDLTGEDVAPVHPDLDREGGPRVGDDPQGPQHPPLVVLHRGGHPGGEDELAAVGVDVRGEEADPLVLRGALHDPGHLVEGGGHRIGTESVVQVVHPLVLDEPHDADAVLGLDLTGLEVVAQADRDATHHRLDRNVAPRSSADGSHRRLAPLQHPAVALGHGGRAPGRASRTARLTTISPASAVASISMVPVAPGPVTISSRCESPTR